MKYTLKEDKAGNKYVEVNLLGYDLINNPMYNKGYGFSDEEKTTFKLHGLLPTGYFSLEERAKKVYKTLQEKPTPLEKHIFLRGLQDRNEVMFYRIIRDNIEELLPLVYTPVVGEACQRFSEIYRKPRGLYISYPEQDKIKEMLSNANFEGAEVIVVTDGERILGLGDQGAGGMGIPIGKLSLYTAIAGIAPYKTLPIILDVGTDNESLLTNPEYVGWQHKRVRGEDYDKFVDKFVTAVKEKFPHILLQFEDFAQPNALKLLTRYRDQLCTFNDDIQGTAAIAVGAILSAIKASGVELNAHKVVLCGAGSAGVGIANLIKDCLVEHGASTETAIGQIFLVDRHGLITDKVDSLDFQKPFIKNIPDSWGVLDKSNITLLETIKNAKATILIGVSAQAGIFTAEIIAEMAKNTKHPIIFPLSNPDSKAEATPEQILKASNGMALVGTGTAFPNIMRNGKSMRVDQVNNCYIFPALGLGILAVKSKRVTDKMFLMAAIALSELSPARTDPMANLLPDLTKLELVAKHIAFAVARVAVDSGLSAIGDKLTDAEIKDLIEKYYWVPEYLPYKN